MPFEIPAQNSNSATTNNPFKTSSSLTGLSAMAPIENASQSGTQSSLVQSTCSNAPPSPSGSSSLSSRLVVGLRASSHEMHFTTISGC
jgi:hypothetical protein